MQYIETVIKTYSGLANEAKPTVGGGYKVPNGSRWREIDTGKMWHYSLSNDTWYLEDLDKIVYTIEDDFSQLLFFRICVQGYVEQR